MASRKNNKSCCNSRTLKIMNLLHENQPAEEPSLESMITKSSNVCGMLSPMNFSDIPVNEVDSESQENEKENIITPELINLDMYNDIASNNNLVQIITIEERGSNNLVMTNNDNILRTSLNAVEEKIIYTDELGVELLAYKTEFPEEANNSPNIIVISNDILKPPEETHLEYIDVPEPLTTTSFSGDNQHYDTPGDKVIPNIKAGRTKEDSKIESDSERESDSSYREAESDTESTSSIEGRKVRPKRLSRKRIRNESAWRVNKRKRARQQGAEYETKLNKTVRSKKLQPPCSCRAKCSSLITEEQRLSLFTDFYALDHNSKNQYLSQLVNEHKKTRVLEGKESRRKYTRDYSLYNGDQKINVCQKMFINTFDISIKKVRHVVEKCRENQSGICPEDKRGKHGNHKTISNEDRAYAVEHIKRFPSYVSHYSRAHTAKKYLSPDLSIQEMYRLYTKYCEENNTKPVSQYFYRHLFVTDFNLSFHPPHNDTCSKCDKLDILIKSSFNDAEKITYMRQKKDHIAAAEMAYKEKRNDKELSRQNENIVTAMFDLQKCLPTPHLKSGIAFYKRQLWVYNLTVYETMKNSNKAKCFLWDETIAGRGGQEIASCLFKYIQGLPAPVQTLNFYSDCCSGQNRNIYLCILFSIIFDFLPEHSELTEINHKFLISGHTHLEADSIHASIEKAKKVSTLDIEIPRDWSHLIKTVPRKGGIQVCDMKQEDFFDLQKVMKAHFTNRKKNTDGETMSFLNSHHFQYRKGENGKVFYRDTFKTECTFKILDISKKHKKDSQKLPQQLPRKYDQYPLSLPKKKLDDLMSLMPFVHPNSRLFFSSLKSSEDNVEGDVCPLPSAEEELEDGFLGE